MLPVPGVGVSVPATGCATIVQVTVFIDEVVQLLPAAVLYVRIDTAVCPLVVRLLPEVYVSHDPELSNLYSRISVVVPEPPLPAVKVADTLLPIQIVPAPGVGVSIPATGCATIVQLTIFTEDVVHEEPLAVLYVLISTEVCPVVERLLPEV